MAQLSNQDVNAGGSPSTEQAQLPAIVAAFLVTFDDRKGYTISWQRTLDSVKIDGVVEFKALPSGLHNIEEDLVYFVHDDYAGISAFLRKDDAEAARNARMLSVGVLVPVESGRMGKSFMYAHELKKLARRLIDEHGNHTPLDEFWEKQKENEEQEQGSPQDTQPLEGYQKLRALSTTTVGTPNARRKLPAHHPALALPHLLDTFGPLVFPLFRAALLRQRILILGEAPVEPACNHVYNVSVFSTVSKALAADIPLFGPLSSHLRPLFNVGVSDIGTLEQLEGSWIACTTDDVLATKPQLFDLLVLLPNSTTLYKSGNRVYPRLIQSTPELSNTFPQRGLRATQRDARRYSALKQAVRTLESSADMGFSPDDDANDAASIASSIATVLDKREVVEPLPWSLIAYTSLIWWASAGDRRSGLMEAEELASEQDEALLREAVTEEGTTKEIALVAYFHKLTILLFSVLQNAAQRINTNGHGGTRDGDNQNEGTGDDATQALLTPKTDDSNEAIEITEEDVRTMGLDIWSESDKKFIEDMIQTWWNRRAVVRGGAIECCGIRIL